jgi:EpsI family protein
MFSALAWAVLGTAAMRALLFPASILLFALPLGDRIAPALQEITARFSVKLLIWSGVPAVLSGHVISIGDGRWRVAEACGGVNYLMASLAVGFVYAGLHYRQWGHRIAFVIAAAVVPIVGNGLRVYTTILLDHLGASAVTSGMEHELYGLFVFTTMVALLLMTCGQWREEPAPAVETPSFPGRQSAATSACYRRTTVCAAAAMLLIVSGPVSGRILKAAREGPDASRQNPPEVSPPWMAVDGDPLGWSPGLATESGGFIQTYASGDRIVRLSLPSHDPTRPGLIRASWILDETPWSAAAERHRPITLDGRSLGVLETVVRSPQTSLLVWTWYSVDGSLTANYYVAKALLARARLFGRSSRGSTVAIATPEQPGVDPAAALTDFLAHISMSPAGTASAGNP